jgi:hypothetical protein
VSQPQFGGVAGVEHAGGGGGHVRPSRCVAGRTARTGAAAG